MGFFFQPFFDEAYEIFAPPSRVILRGLPKKCIVDDRQSPAGQGGGRRDKIRADQYISTMLFDQIGKLEFFPAKVIHVVIESLQFGLGLLKFFIIRLLIRFVSKNPLHLRMRVFSSGLGKLDHVGFDPGGGDIEVLQIKEDFQKNGDLGKIAC